jgi:hypothetical protein
MSIKARIMEAMLSTPTAAERAPRIFNHDILSCTAEGVVGNHLYSGRILGATEPGDLILLNPELRSQWPAISAHYRRIGLSHTRDVIWDTDPKRLTDYPDHHLSVFFFGPAEHEARPDHDWYGMVETINSKNAFMDAAARLGVPVPSTIPFAAVSEIGEPDIAAAPYPCYLKAAVSVAGVGIHRCATPSDLRAAMSTFEPSTPVQIQQEVVTQTFLNLQYRVERGKLERHAATVQVLDGYVHQGNRHPSDHAPWDLVDPIARWLHAEGIKGVFAFDVAVVDRPGGGCEYLAIECNPRFNGASYPTAVAHKLGVEHWLARAFKTRHRDLAQVDLGGIEYDPGTREGVILINWGPILVGKLLLLLAGDIPKQQELVEALSERL